MLTLKLKGYQKIRIAAQFSIFAFSFFLTICVVSNDISFGQNSESKVSEEGVEQLTEQLRSKSYQYYILGLIARSNNEFNKAIELFLESASYNSSAIRPIVKATEILINQNRLDEALKIADLGLSRSANNIELLTIKSTIYAKQNRHEDAISHYEKIVKIDPSRSDITILIGITLFYNKNQSEGLAVLRENLKKNRNDPASYYYLGRLLVASGDSKEAAKLFRKMTNKFPSDRRGWEALVLLYRQAKNYSKAIKVSNRYLTLYPSDTVMIAQIIDTFFLAGDYKGATSNIEQLLASAPDSSYLLYHLAITNIKLAEERQETIYYEKAIELLEDIQPDTFEYSMALLQLAISEEAVGRLAKGVVALEKKLKLDGIEHPQSKIIGLKIVELNERQGKYEDAKRHVNNLIEVEPGNSNLYYYLGVLELQLNNDSEAVDAFKVALRHEPENIDYLFNLSVALERVGQFESAVRVIKKVIYLDPMNAAALNHMGYIYADLGIHLEEAEVSLLKALRIEPDSGYFLDSLAWVYFKQGRFEEALTKIKTAALKMKLDPVVYEHLGDIERALGNDQEAIDAYKKSLEALDLTDSKEVDRKVVNAKINKILSRLNSNYNSK